MKVAPRCYAVTGLSCEAPWTVNAGFVVGEESTLIIDTGSNYLSAKTIYGYAMAVRGDNKFLVANTEPHFDHIGGNSFFAEKDIPLYAHANVKRTQAEFEANKQDMHATILHPARRKRNESEAFYVQTELANPTESVEAWDVFKLGGAEVSVLETPGHTPCNISLFVEAHRVLYCGDSVVESYLPNLEANPPADGENWDREQWHTWLKTLDMIEKTNPKVLIPGHGRIITHKNLRKELDAVREVLNKAIVAGEPPK